MSIGFASPLNNDALFFQQDIPIDVEVSVMLQRVLKEVPREVRKTFLELFESKSLDYPYCFIDKFIPLVLILHGLNAWSSEDQITEQSISWLIDICFILANKQDIEFEEKKNLLLEFAMKGYQVSHQYAWIFLSP